MTFVQEILSSYYCIHRRLLTYFIFLFYHIHTQTHAHKHDIGSKTSCWCLQFGQSHSDRRPSFCVRHEWGARRCMQSQITSPWNPQHSSCGWFSSFRWRFNIRNWSSIPTTFIFPVRSVRCYCVITLLCGHFFVLCLHHSVTSYIYQVAHQFSNHIGIVYLTLQQRLKM